MYLPYSCNIKSIDKYIAKFDPTWYKQSVFTEYDFSEGIKCGDTIYYLKNEYYPFKEPVIPYNYYLFLKQLWLDNDTSCSYEEWNSWFDENACSDWCKQDVHGVCYGGAWQEENTNPDRYKNAYQICRDENSKALWELTKIYPHTFIKETIKIGCSNRNESVPYTVLLCEWMKRKLKLELELESEAEAEFEPMPELEFPNDP
jgi:hypothetical protein